MNHLQAPMQPVLEQEVPVSKERILLLILAVIQFTHIMDFMIMVPLGPRLIDVFQISTRQFSFLVSAYTFSAGISGFTSAFFIDRFDRKYALVALYLGFTIGTFACAMSPNYYFLLTARTLTGIFGGVIGALIYAIIGDAIPAQRRGKAMGIVMSSFAIASVAGVPFGLFLADKLDWHAPFFLLAGLSLFLWFIALKVLPSMRKHMLNQTRISPAMVISNVLNSPSQMWSLGLMMMMMMAGFAVIPLLSTYMVKNVGFSQSQLAYIYLTGGSVSFFSSIIVGRLADKYGKAKIFIISALLSIIPILILTNLSRTPIPVALSVFAFFFVFTNGRMVPAMALITSSVVPQQRGSFMSINSSIQSVSAGLAAFLAGFIVFESPATKQLVNFNLVGYFSVAAVLVCILIVSKIKPVAEKPEQTQSK
jgi:predicted MFS family arabinose efflux permease